LFFKKAGDKVSTALRSTIETDAKAAIKESKKNDGEEEEDAAEEEPVQKSVQDIPENATERAENPVSSAKPSRSSKPKTSTSKKPHSSSKSTINRAKLPARLDVSSSSPLQSIEEVEDYITSTLSSSLVKSISDSKWKTREEAVCELYDGLESLKFEEQWGSAKKA
ncbi:hypothetical protein ADUPG1_003377, partial [Aduncisulcus paluster]